MQKLARAILLLGLLGAATATKGDDPPTAADPSPSSGGQTSPGPATMPAQVIPPGGAIKHTQDGSRPAPGGLLTPLPETGGVPPIVGMLNATSANELTQRAEVRGYARQIREMRHKYFGDIKVEKLRQEGIAQIREFTDPAAFTPLIEELRNEKDDVRLALLDHFASRGEEGQAALAYIVVTDRDAAIRNEATQRLTTPPPPPVLRVLDAGLRSKQDFVANMSGQLAGTLHVLNSIPLLIMAQVAPPPQGEQPAGDLAWIAIETQRAYVAGLQPIAGNGAAAFAPIVGVVTDGSVMRVVDAVVIIYRTEIHNILVGMTSDDWGQSTEYLGYDINAWWHWYNEEYLPHKNAQNSGGDSAGEPGVVAAQVKTPTSSAPSSRPSN